MLITIATHVAYRLDQTPRQANEEIKIKKTKT